VRHKFYQIDKLMAISKPHIPHLNDQKTPIWQVKAHEQWVKTVLISDIVEPNSTVAELCCGKGLDIGKWARAKILKFCGIDSNLLVLEEAKERWLQKKEPFPAQFLQLDLFTENSQKIIPKGELFDNVCCFNNLEYSFETKEKAQMFLENVASILKPGGYFFGILPDSSAIWYKAQKVILGKTDKSLSIKGDLFTIQFLNEDFHHFGTSYTMKMEGSPEQQEYLVHFPSFVSVADSVGLTMLEITNLVEFYEDHRKNYSELLKALGVLNKQGKIEPQQKDIIGLYTVFCFQRTEKSTPNTTFSS